MNMIRKSGSTCRLTFETADSSGSAAVLRAAVKVVSVIDRVDGLLERNAAQASGMGKFTPKRVIRCLTTVYSVLFEDSNAVFTL